MHFANCTYLTFYYEIRNDPRISGSAKNTFVIDWMFKALSDFYS